MDIVEARVLLKALVRDRKLQKHSILMSYMMREVGTLFNGDLEEWEICGMLHDIDLPQVVLNYELHGLVAAEVLKNEDVSPRIIEAIAYHEKKKSDREPIGAVLYILEELTKDPSFLRNFEDLNLSEEGKEILNSLEVDEEELVEAIKRGIEMFLKDYEKGGFEDEI